MASTRNKNMPAEYSREQFLNKEITKININEYGRSYQDMNPTHMMNYGSMSRDALSNNAIDTESMLFGIGSTNLVTPQAPPKPQVKKLNDVHFCEKKGMVYHDDIKVMNNQRPMRR